MAGERFGLQARPGTAPQDYIWWDFEDDSADGMLTSVFTGLVY